MKDFIHGLPCALFLLCMVPFFMLSTSIFGFVPEFYFTDTFAYLVFDGFKLAAAFAALAFFVLLFDTIVEEL
jgi:hypothetical protein